MNDLEVEGEVPAYPPKIIGTQVLHSPFDDIVPRNIVHPHLVKGDLAKRGHSPPIVISRRA
jgi:hypothetical protein